MEKELNQQTVENFSNNCIEYNGKITVKIFEDQRMLSNHTYYNNGTNKLFTFLINCLSGDFNTAKANRPCRLILLKSEEGEVLADSTPIETNTNSQGKNYWGDNMNFQAKTFTELSVDELYEILKSRAEIFLTRSSSADL